MLSLLVMDPRFQRPVPAIPWPIVVESFPPRQSEMASSQTSCIDEGGKILQQLAKEWRELVAGSEGFLTDKKRRSLFHNILIHNKQA
jgi:hypothetical protein